MRTGNVEDNNDSKQNQDLGELGGHVSGSPGDFDPNDGDDDETGNTDTSSSSHYQPGKPYTKSELQEMGAVRVRNDVVNVKSPNFKEFIRSQGQRFRYNEWNKHMETWELPNGTRVENHFWRHKSGETWFHN